MAEPKVSIIVPVYNVEQYLKRCIDSLRNQTLKEIEIILVDDSSTDSSLAICQEMAAEDSRIKVIHKENQGAGMARNAALAVASGEYIGFVDSDDYVAPEMFRFLLQKAEQYGAELVLSGVLHVGGVMFSKEGACERKDFFAKDTLFETEDTLKKLRMGIAGALPEDADDSKYGMSIWKNLFKREIIQKNHLGFQSEREVFSEDALFMIDYIACIEKAIGINEAFYYYCRNEASISKSYKKDRFEKCLVFMQEVEKRLKKDLKPEEYGIYLNRFWQAMCRVTCSQEILYAIDHKKKAAELKQRLKTICTHPLTVRALKEYPLNKLPLGQRVFAYGMKSRCYPLLKMLVRLRNR